MLIISYSLEMKNKEQFEIPKLACPFFIEIWYALCNLYHGMGFKYNKFIGFFFLGRGSMKNGFLVFDIETPNNRHDRICQIGFVRHTGEHNPLDSRTFLVNPEAPFDDSCRRIHGICANDVQGKPTFADLWERELHALFADSILVAHNASFDLGVLTKTLRFYDFELPTIQYIDTLELARKYYPALPNHKLGTVSSYLGNSITKAHDAHNDAHAAYVILIETLRQFGPSALSTKHYQLVSKPKPKRTSITELTDILSLIVEDGRISFEEAWILNEWLSQNRYGIPEALYEELSSLLFAILLDGRIDSDEEAYLMKTINTILRPTEVVDGIEFIGKFFVLTGDFSSGSKEEIAEHINGKGGTIKSGISKSVDYVVVGNLGSDRYTHGTYGTKVLKAMELQKQGLPIKIVHEEELFPEGR